VKRSDKARQSIEARIYRHAMGEPPESVWKILAALLFEKGFATRVLRKRLKLATPLNTTDRAVLEQRIFPYYKSDARIHDVLFVGCNTYTAHYQRAFFPSANFVTIEPDITLSRFGARNHIVAPLEDLAAHCQPRSFDLIICNGVYGWGLDELDQCDAAFGQCYTCLRASGQLLLGWDDLPSRKPVALDDIPSLARFRKYVFPALGTWRFVTETPFRHTYDFYQKS
jgi:SAM-dependent methyltransferase